MAAALGRTAHGAQPFARLRHKAMGSNMYAFGPDATADGSSMVYGNPHFPWTGSERLYMVHLTVPGQMDIAGVSLYGTPVVLIGFNDHVAWSHTVSTAYRFTFYKLQLDRNDPTRYVVTDGSGQRKVKAMDVCKRLLDYGFHAPTVYFPLVVSEALMMEPTETESVETLDAFADALLKIKGEDAELLRAAPHTQTISRPDEVKAAKEPVLRWHPPATPPLPATREATAGSPEGAP